MQPRRFEATNAPDLEWLGPPPVATVTLAEIYVARVTPSALSASSTKCSRVSPTIPPPSRSASGWRTSDPPRQSASAHECPTSGSRRAVPVEVEQDASDEAPVAVRQPFLSGGASHRAFRDRASAVARGVRGGRAGRWTPFSPKPRSTRSKIPEGDFGRRSRSARAVRSAEVPAPEPESLESLSAEPLPESASFAFEEEVPSAPISDYEPVPSSESPFSTMNPERTILDYAVDEPAERRGVRARARRRAPPRLLGHLPDAGAVLVAHRRVSYRSRPNPSASSARSGSTRWRAGGLWTASRRARSFARRSVASRVTRSSRWWSLP